MLGFSFPPFKSWFLVYFGLLILLYLTLSSGRLKQAFGRAYLALLILNAITLYWISGWHSNDTFLKLGGMATVLVHPLFMIIPVLIIFGVYRASNKYLALILFPLIWIGFEFFDNQWQFSFPWLELGDTEAYNLNRIQYTEYVGVHGISFLICSATALIYLIAGKLYQRKWNLFDIKSIALFILIIIILLFPNWYSSVKLDEEKNEKYFQTNDSTKIINACIIQPNVDPYDKWSKQHNPDSFVDSYMVRLNEALKKTPQLIVLNETAAPYYFFEPYYYNNTQKFINFVNTNNRFLLMGIPHLYYYPDSNTAPKDSKVMKSSGKKYDTFNSAVLIEPGKRVNEYTIHKKVKLVPFSERIPYQEYLPFLQNIISWGVGISSWQRGKELVLFKLDDPNQKPRAAFETLICYESVFSEFVSEGIKNGAEFIVIVTNDGWWGNTAGPYQHEQYAVLRAIENRKWIVRCAQTGVSCFIDPLGKIYDEIPYYAENITARNIIANNEKTFYSQNGDIIGRIGFYIFIASLVISVGSYIFRKIKPKNA
ncbi:MAG TPA: apolipoprotein N-acyltransferase [Ignavibacteria bacterium]